MRIQLVGSAAFGPPRGDRFSMSSSFGPAASGTRAVGRAEMLRADGARPPEMGGITLPHGHPARFPGSVLSLFRTLLDERTFPARVSAGTISLRPHWNGWGTPLGANTKYRGPPFPFTFFRSPPPFSPSSTSLSFRERVFSN